MTIGLCACGSGSDNLPVDAPVADTYCEPSQSSAVHSSADTNISSAEASSPHTEAVADAEPLRDATPVCLVPRADGTATASNDVAVIDYSHMSDGYVCANYTGTCPKVKLRITGPDTVVYTYDLHGGGYETFPLSSGDGYYDVTIYENISGTNYATCLYADLDVQITDAFSPFLYPNQYVNFTADSKVVAKGQELAEGASSDLEVITRIYDYITQNITYDYDKASDPPTGYTSDVDAILASSAASDVYKRQYHAWISVYTADTGWLNGIIEFDGNVWTLVDPTFGANTDDKTLKKFIGDGSNYILQKMY